MLPPITGVSHRLWGSTRLSPKLPLPPANHLSSIFNQNLLPFWTLPSDHITTSLCSGCYPIEVSPPHLLRVLASGGLDGKAPAYNVGDLGLIPGSGRWKEMATHSSILAWKIPWTEGLVGYSPRGHKESDMSEWLHFHFGIWITVIQVKPWSWVTLPSTWMMNSKLQFQSVLTFSCSNYPHGY